MKQVSNLLMLSLALSVLSTTSMADQIHEGTSEPTAINHVTAEGNAKDNFLGFHAQALLHLSYDERFSPLVYHSPNWGASIHYEHRGTVNHHMVMVIFGIGRALNGFDDSVSFINEEGEEETLKLESLQVQGALNYAYHRAIATSRSGETKFYWGALFDAYVNIVSSSEFNWLAAYSLNLSAQVTADLTPRHFLAFRFYFPFLTYLCRPPWSIYDDPVMDVPEWENVFQGRITSLHGYVRLTGELRYEFALTDAWRLSFAYGISYFYTDDPSPMHALANNLLVGVTPGFGGVK